MSVRDPENSRRLKRIIQRVETHLSNMEGCNGSGVVVVRVVIKDGRVTVDSDISVPERII